MKKSKGKIWFFVVALLILVFSYTAVFGVTTSYGDIVTTKIKSASDIRFGIDIRGGVDATFMPAGSEDATQAQLDAVQEVMEQRLVGLNITDYEIYTDDTNDQVIVRFPWKEGETDFDPESAINEIGATAKLTFREGNRDPAGTVIIEGADVKSASAVYDADNFPYNGYAVSLTLNDSGKQAFADATTRLASSNGYISIYMDDDCISSATVNSAITEGQAVIEGDFTADEVVSLANKINAGALPFDLKVASFSTISPTLGDNSLEAMVMAGIIAFILVSVYMIIIYRLPGFVSCIALLGQTAGTLACISGYFAWAKSFTLTLPGIAGIILAIGMGVDANVITAARIKEELRSGKSLDGALNAGFRNGLTPIVDGNITVMIVAIILIGAFGPTDGFFAKLLTPVFFAFGAATTGSIYSFGYTLLIGVLLNFLMAVGASRVMIRGLSKISFLRSEWLYGGARAGHTMKPVRTFNFVGNRKKFFVFSTVLMCTILLFSVIFGVAIDIQFKGGALINYGYTGTMDIDAFTSSAKQILGNDINVQTGTSIATGDSTLTISLPGTENVTTADMDELTAKLQSEFPDSGLEVLEVNNVNASIGKKFLLKSIVAVLTAFALILVYIAIRFRRIGGWSAGSFAIVALMHDLMVVFGVFVIGRIALNSNFMAAILTILGYSINDTVVVYDRIRENRSLYGNKLSFSELVNQSINQSLLRSLNTTITTVLALTTVSVVGIVYGLTSIVTFALPMTIGLISGWYSSICLAGPLWVQASSKKMDVEHVKSKKK